MKQRLSSLDVSCIANELSHTLVTLRLTQIYDLSSRIFLLKFGLPGKRESLIVDAGFRAHLTSFTRTAASEPSAFVRKLRKHLKSRRVTGVQQLGKDRIIELTFSEGIFRLYLEFFAAGNIILTDREGTVLCLWRVVSEGDEEVDVKVGGKYNIDGKQESVEVTLDSIRDVLTKSVEKAKAIDNAAAAGAKKGKRRKAQDELKKVVATGFPEFSVQLVEHSFLKEGVDMSLKPEDVLREDNSLQKVLNAMLIAQGIARSISQDGPVTGYIIAQVKPGELKEEEVSTAEEKRPETSIPTSAKPPPRESLLYEDFHPFLPLQFTDSGTTHILHIPTFNATVDEFYSSLESQKLSTRLTERQEKAARKIEEVKSEHEKRVGALQQAQDLHVRKAQAIEANTHRVEEACTAVNGLIAQGMDWMDIAKLIEGEQSRGNAVAKMVKLPLKLYENTITLLLDEPGNEGDEDGEEEDADMTDEEVLDASSDDEDHNKHSSKKDTPPNARLAVDIDLSLTPWANAREFYDAKKVTSAKQAKTLSQSAAALSNAQKKIEADLRKGLKEEKPLLRASRRHFWFEKFFFFISSDGYLVLGGKDATQNDILYRKHLRRGDVYVSADLQGAASVIIKNIPSHYDDPIPPSTLSQAGNLAICTSTAWDSKAVMGAWWVDATQVSKTAPSGEYLTAGGFVVRGKKNFLPPSQLLLGFGVLFVISEESRKNHTGKGRYAELHDSTAEAVAKRETIETEEIAQTDENMRDLTLKDRLAERDQASPHATNAAHELDSGILEKHDEEANSSEDQSLSDEDDAASTPASETGANIQRANPLQTNGPNSQRERGTNGKEILDESGIESEDGDHDIDDSVQEGDIGFDQEDNDEDKEEIDDNDNNEKKDEPNAFSDAPSIPVQAPAAAAASQSKPKSTGPLPRGKRSKAARKAAAKYADQDDDDRALAMTLLGGSAKAQQRQAAEKESKEAREAKAAADRERRKAQHERAAQREAERHARMAAGANAGADANLEQTDQVEEDPETAAQERADLASLDELLVGVPAVGDKILAAVPTVAPWGACGGANRFKYKVKLQPGSVKKGKAVKEIVGRWADLLPSGVVGGAGTGSKMNAKIVDVESKDRERVWPGEIEAIKAWRVEEVVGSVPVGKVRVVWSGGLGGLSSGSSGGGGGGANKAGGGGGGGRGGRGSKKR